MSYDAKIASARGVLETHNSRLSNKSAVINIDQFFTALQDKGGTTEEGLAAANWDDIRACGVPDILARQIASIFRSNEAAATATKYVSEKHAKRLTPPELVELYDPKEADSPIATRLKEIAGDKPFVVFNDDGSVDKKATLKLLTELREGHPPREMYLDGGLPREIYTVGQRPDNFVEINPLFPQETLRPGAECANIGKSWASVSLETRQLIYLARKNGELRVTDLRDAISVHSDAIMDGGFNKIATYCPKAALEYSHLKFKGELPSLRATLSAGSRRNDPFYGSRR